MSTAAPAEHNLPSVSDISDIQGKRVLVRAGLNVPIDDGAVRNAFRIEKALPTLEYLRKNGARTIIVSHIGRNPHETLSPVYTEMKKHMPLRWIDTLVRDVIERSVEELQDGDVLLLENLRNDPREMENTDSFARLLAEFGDVYINDAFSVSHRAHASIVGIPKYLPSYAGMQFIDEYTELSRLQNPESPSLFALGGAKFVTKAPLVAKYVERYDHVFVGGALANDFYRAMGYEIGKSIISDIDLTDSPLLHHERILLPLDVTVYNEHGREVKDPKDVSKEDTILDAGPKTMEMLTKCVKGARTILWNGPLGDYEFGFPECTEQFAKAIAASPGFSVIGGGDTVAAIESLKLNDKFGFVSTAGGAMLQFLEQGTLPGIDALLANQKDRTTRG